MRHRGQHSSYWDEEKRKLSQLTTSQKISYILEYYWLWIAGLVLALFLLIYIPYRAFFTIKDYWFYGVFANTMADAGNGSGLWRDFAEWTGYDLSEKQIQMNAASYFDPAKAGGTNNSYYQSFVAMIESGDLDVVTLGIESLTALGSSGRLLDLQDERAAAVYAKYQDRLIYCEPYNEEYSSDPVPIGIDISDSTLVTRYHVYEGGCALGIGAYTSRPEAAEAFLAFILPDENQ